jgi:hypothetical protein
MSIRTLASLCLFASLALGAGPALTVYNQDFATIRETIPLDLKAGTNQVRFSGVTARLEPESVILRDPGGKHALRILEQNYRADPVTVERLLQVYEGKTIDFLVRQADSEKIVPGRIVRSGYTTPAPGNPQYWQQAAARREPPIIEVDGKLRFDLPGIPLLPALADDTVLKPTLDWLIQSSQPGKFDAELCYVTGGLNWKADYNFVAGETGDDVDLVGWVAIDNHSGRTFENAWLKLMAGDVNKLQPAGVRDAIRFGGSVAGFVSGPGGPPPVTQKSFDEYHLYTLTRPATLHDGETKQVEFVRAAGIKSRLVYVYDGAKIDLNQLQSWNWESLRTNPSFGAQSDSKVWVMRELENSEENHLGMPLPAGRTRFYRRDDDGRLEFTGEDDIRHTPRGETIRVLTGAAFDLVGERRRLSFRINHANSTIDESFEIKVRNRKRTPVEVRVVEHLYRWYTWEIQSNSLPYKKIDSRTVEFSVPLAPDEEKTVIYTVHYSW